MPNIDTRLFCQYSGVCSEVASLGIAAFQACVLDGNCTWLNLVRQFLDPYDLWFNTFFQGRPRVGEHSATDCLALFLIPSGNPVIQTWGMGIRIAEGLGCSISQASGPCISLHRRMAASARADLHSQFGVSQGEVLFSGYSKALVADNPCSSRIALRGRVVLDTYYANAVRSGFIDPVTGFPYPRKPPPPTPGRCCN